MLDRVRDVGGQRFDRELARHVLQHAALLDARRLVGADELKCHSGLNRAVEPDAEQVDVDRSARDRVAG